MAYKPESASGGWRLEGHPDGGVIVARTIADLKIYTAACAVEDEVWQLIKSRGAKADFELVNRLRRSSAAIAHHVQAAHDEYSYKLKIDSLNEARRAAEELQMALAEAKGLGLSVGQQLLEQITSVIKQDWGLIKYLKAKQAETKGQRPLVNSKT